MTWSQVLGVNGTTGSRKLVSAAPIRLFLPNGPVLRARPRSFDVRGQHRADVFRGRVSGQTPQGVAQRGVARRDLDAAQDALLGLGTEPGHAPQPAAPDRLL